MNVTKCKITFQTDDDQEIEVSIDPEKLEGKAMKAMEVLAEKASAYLSEGSGEESEEEDEDEEEDEEKEDEEEEDDEDEEDEDEEEDEEKEDEEEEDDEDEEDEEDEEDFHLDKKVVSKLAKAKFLKEVVTILADAGVDKDDMADVVTQVSGNSDVSCPALDGLEEDKIPILVKKALGGEPAEKAGSKKEKKVEKGGKDKAKAKKKSKK